MTTLQFRIDATRPASRELNVRSILTSHDAANIEFFLPTWTPGSYLIREYSRHLSRVEAYEAGTDRRLTCSKSQKNRFLVEADGATSIELRYRVYAHELSVRTADVDASHAYWNHACLLLWPSDLRDIPTTITVEHQSDWSLSCSLRATPADTPSGNHASTTLHAADLAEALDAPVLIGATKRLEWLVSGIPHAIVLDGLGAVVPPTSLCADLERIVIQAAAVFGGSLPYRNYVFLALFAGEGYGGLEHRDSSTLLMPRTSLTTERGYRDFLVLAAHELFHAWNVKRMRPIEFWDYDYERESYTQLLWVMEGWTAYYDDLLLARAGLMTHSDYLATMAKNIQNMLAAPGRFELSLEESSFDAWIRLYRPDENTRNSSQNYYGNGAVVAMCLDLLIRRSTSGKSSLDEVLRSLYQETFEEGRGYELADVERIVARIGGQEVVDELRTLISGTLDPQVDDLLGDVGVQANYRDKGKPYLGVGFRTGSTVIASVVKDSPAHVGGLAPDDELVAIQNLRVTSANWQTVFRAVAQCEESIELLLARRGVLQSLQVTPTKGPGILKLRLDDNPTELQTGKRQAWLGVARSDSEESTPPMP